MTISYVPFVKVEHSISEVLVNRYKRKIINFIHKMIFDYDEAQSLTQDVFLKVYQSIGNYTMQDNFQAFIFTIAKNLTLNYIKKHKRISWISSLTGNGDNSSDVEGQYFQTQETQHAALESSQREELLTMALKELKENQRIALILKVYLEFSYKKIAEITGWSQPKIETLISRAKSRLREHIREMEEIGPGAVSPPEASKSPLPGQKMQESIRSNVINMRSI